MTAQVRRIIYVAVLVIGGAAVALGVIDQGTVDQIALIVMGVLGIGSSGLALRHISADTAAAVVTVQDVIDAIRADQDTTAGGRHRTDDLVSAVRSRADQVRARYGAA